MADTSRYTLAQALWLAREYPKAKIDPPSVERVEFVYEYERGWSSWTPGGSSFEIVCHHRDGHRAVIDSTDTGLSVDLTRMVLEGLALLEEIGGA